MQELLSKKGKILTNFPLMLKPLIQRCKSNKVKKNNRYFCSAK